jgi:hypothetical protein
MEFITQPLLELLNFDPVLIGIFAALSMLYVQALKPVWSVARDYPQLLNIAFTFLFAMLIVFNFTAVLQVFVLTYMMMIGASGIYASAKNAKEPDDLSGLS